MTYVDHSKQKIQGREAEKMTQWQIDRMPSNEDTKRVIATLRKRGILTTVKEKPGNNITCPKTGRSHSILPDNSYIQECPWCGKQLNTAEAYKESTLTSLVGKDEG